MSFDPLKADFAAAQKLLSSERASTAGNAWNQAIALILSLADDGSSNTLNDYLNRYLGPMPGAGDSSGYLALYKSFAPIDKCLEVLRRHRNGVVGREPAFELAFDAVPRKRERQRQTMALSDAQAGAQVIAEANAALTAFADAADATQGAWWDERGGHEIVKRFALHLLARRRCFWRYDVPPGLLVEGVDRTNPQQMALGVDAATWQEALDSIYFEVCAPGSTAIYDDPRTKRKTGVFHYEEEDDNGNKTKCIQLSWVDKKTKLTMVRVVRERGDDDNWTVDTGGQLLVIGAQIEAFLTPGMVRLENIISTIATMIKFNGDVAGFPQTTMLDVDKPAVETTPGNSSTRTDTSLNVGPGSASFLMSYMDVDASGNPLLDGNGKPIIRQGQAIFRNPVDSKPLRDDAEWFETQLYRAANQGHIAARRSANASAAMLVQDRADFADSLLQTKPHIEGALRKLLDGVFCLAASLAGDTGALSNFKQGRMTVTCNLNAGPLSVEERAEIRATYKDGLLARETTIVMLGTEDVDAETTKIEEDAARRAESAPAPVTVPPDNAPKAG
jgi:hypothetical protein